MRSQIRWLSEVREFSELSTELGAMPKAFAPYATMCHVILSVEGDHPSTVNQDRCIIIVDYSGSDDVSVCLIRIYSPHLFHPIRNSRSNYLIQWRYLPDIAPCKTLSSPVSAIGLEDKKLP